MGLQPENIVLDHTAEAFQFLQVEPARLAYFSDNCGKELFFDLAFMDFLLNSELATSITCFLKNQPFFVSDAMPEDFHNSIQVLAGSENEDVHSLAGRLTL